MFILIMTSSWISNAQKTIKVPFHTGNGGLMYVDASVNGVNESFIFDTGASGISINSDIFADMVNKNMITQNDILGEIDMVMANGKTSKALMINIKSFQLGSIILKNIEAIVMPQNNAPALIGQNMFKKFGNIAIDYNKNIISFIETQPSVDDIALEEIKLITCNVNKKATKLKIKKILPKINNLEYEKITEEKNIPPVKAIKRLKSNITIRIFDNADFDSAKKIKNQLKKYKSFANSKIRIENMLPYFKNRAIPGYIEIWIR